MENSEIRTVRSFLESLAQYYFLLAEFGVADQASAKDFIASNQEEEPVLEAFLIGLVRQNDFFPPDPEVWLEMARLCHFDDAAILDDQLELTDGGPVSDWYIYPKLLKWLITEASDPDTLSLTERDRVFLAAEIH